VSEKLAANEGIAEGRGLAFLMLNKVMLFTVY
jgi:hypothetical protein